MTRDPDDYITLGRVLFIVACTLASAALALFAIALFIEAVA